MQNPWYDFEDLLLEAIEGVREYGRKCQSQPDEYFQKNNRFYEENIKR